MKICIKALLAMTFVFLILFVAGCGDKEDDTGGNDNNGGGQDITPKTIQGIECMLVKAGTFTMGSPKTESGRNSDETQHKVTITQDYYISKYPITQAQYQAVMGNNPSYFSGRDSNPVENVNWYDVNDFCEAVGGRLPTEAEWEFAARGGINSKRYIYSGGNKFNTVGWSSENSGNQTQPVGQKSPNELGIYDMSGNVWEWCGDYYGTYPTEEVIDPTSTDTNSGYRVQRGGAWNDTARYCRVAIRGSFPSGKFNFLGFRVVFPC